MSLTVHGIAMSQGIKWCEELFTAASDSGMGGVELYASLAKFAELDEKLSTAVHEAIGEHPGVWLYEVSEPAGTAFARNLIEGVPEANKISLGMLAVEFLQGKISPLELEKALAVISKMTGYLECSNGGKNAG